MPKLLIAIACAIAGEETSRHVDVGETVEVPKDEAHYLARIGRGFYLDKADDPTKGQLTASKDDIDQVKRQAKAIAMAAEERAAAAAASSPATMMAAVAAQVAAAVQSALKPAA